MPPSAERFESARFGPYVLVSRLGKGGMAEVFKARMAGAHGFEKVVCLKRILPQLAADRRFVEMFINEARISAHLSHPNVVQVFDLGEVGGEVYMAMELVAGRDLLRIMREWSRRHEDDAPPPPAACAYIAREMCRGLGHAHEQLDERGQRAPIVHRDVSPQNVIISYDGVVKLLDFGIAKAAQAPGEETRTGVLKGKFAYMAPEQFGGEKASPLTDIWAAGVVLFELLTARRLFKGVNDFETLSRVKAQPIPRPSEMAPAVPPELDRIVLQALERDPARRYQRAGQVARDLETFCARAGFGADDLREFMERLWPEREEVPDGIVAPSTPPSRSLRPEVPTVGAERPELATVAAERPDVATVAAERPDVATVAAERPGVATLALAPVIASAADPTGSDPSARPFAPFGGGTGAGTSTGRVTPLPTPPPLQPNPPPGRDAAMQQKARRRAALAVGLACGAAGLIIGTAIVIRATSTSSAAHTDPAALPLASAPVAGAEAPAAPAKSAKPAAAPTPPPPTVLRVRLSTTPAGAEVHDGTARLGLTPLDISLDASAPRRTLRITHRGYEPITYSMADTDAPAVTLPLSPQPRPPAPPAPKRPRPRTPRIEILDD